ncbi:zinc-dependent metalloprotease [Demequina sp. TTPB684]|uniref:zinc-dependent metalloprotease n=1 Tax=unclassified Demequina TaxID=2620311 RepID=UPI001CF4D54B|nr:MULTISPECIES: zinc-dependent metalloprotease [unclassified Demequina]MCB2412071.1 zinc-dependent metalloprotease [Demequina sp. TTPB684]UPU88525.1 zinc-dependent metalloprotease [Demequina sp. TMPB413]
MADAEEQWMKLLRELFGDDAEEALDQMRQMGMDPSALAQASGMANAPGMMDHMLGQIRALMSQSQGEDVNWTLAHDVARGVAAQGGDPVVTAAQAREYRSTVSQAELWLDAATDFDPSRAQPAVWSRAEWVEATLPTWRFLAGPVASSVSLALGGVLRDDSGILDGPQAQGLLGSVSPTVCGMHMGQAAGAMAREAFGATDLGIPLLAEPRVALVPQQVEQFAEGLDIELADVRLFLALREAAHVRLFASAPWLPGQLHAAIERYARGVTVDIDALDNAVREAGMGDPAALQKALTTGIFAPTPTAEQATTLESIETWLALIEGWVDEVTARAAAPHLPALGQLREMMRRRRAAGGPAEDTFSALLGLTLRPRRLRDAADMWSALTNRLGTSARDALWRHPDLLPEAEALADWRAWVEQATSEERSDDFDKEIEALLSGTWEGPDEGDEGKSDTASGA